MTSETGLTLGSLGGSRRIGVKSLRDRTTASFRSVLLNIRDAMPSSWASDAHERVRNILHVWYVDRYIENASLRPLLIHHGSRLHAEAGLRCTVQRKQEIWTLSGVCP